MTAGRPGAGPAGNPLAVLGRLGATRPAPSAQERCEMCAVDIGADHQHVVDVVGRGLMCTCRPCYLLFIAEEADLRYRAVPDRYLAFPEFAVFAGEWDALEIPVGLAFFFVNSALGRTVAFYPGPAGATESELPLGAWERIVAANPGFALVRPDVEALIVRMPDEGPASGAAQGAAGPVAYLLPIDRCYALVGSLRRVWRGFDGGQDARAALDAFFADLGARGTAAPVTAGPAMPTGSEAAP